MKHIQLFRSISISLEKFNVCSNSSHFSIILFSVYFFSMRVSVQIQCFTLILLVLNNSIFVPAFSFENSVERIVHFIESVI